MGAIVATGPGAAERQAQPDCEDAGLQRFVRESDECPDVLQHIREWMADGPPVCEDAQLDSGTWLQMSAVVTKACQVLQKLPSSGDQVNYHMVKSTLTA